MLLSYHYDKKITENNNINYVESHNHIGISKDSGINVSKAMCTADDPSDSDAVILLSELLKLNHT